MLLIKQVWYKGPMYSWCQLIYIDPTGRRKVKLSSYRQVWLRVLVRGTNVNFDLITIGHHNVYSKHVMIALQYNIPQHIFVSMHAHDTLRFSTYDRDQDADNGRNCAVLREGARWYNACAHSNSTSRELLLRRMGFTETCTTHLSTT